MHFFKILLYYISKNTKVSRLQDNKRFDAIFKELLREFGQTMTMRDIEECFKISNRNLSNLRKSGQFPKPIQSLAKKGRSMLKWDTYDIAVFKSGDDPYS